MSKQFYAERKFRLEARELIATMNDIVEEYVGQGYRLTVRQLYYQLVARGYIENTERSYQRICSTVNDAKLAGLMDWDAIEDRTRAFIRRTRWENGSAIMSAAASGFHMDMWSNQAIRVFVIVEKEALAGVLEGVCNELDILLLAARGYPSGTVLREFALSDLLPAIGYTRHGEPVKGFLPGRGGKAFRQTFCILHFGDHDPSGIDMSRDLGDRLALFCGFGDTKLGTTKLFKRVALNMDQVEEQSPPENPAKVTDSLFADYSRKYGDKSWELDALKPDYLASLVRTHATRLIDQEKWEQRQAEVEEVRGKIQDAAARFEEEA